MTEDNMDIREGIARKLAEFEDFEWDYVDEVPTVVLIPAKSDFLRRANQILQFLKDNNVVKKVDRELPEHPYRYKGESYFDESVPSFRAWHIGQQSLIDAGYVAVEPLMREIPNEYPFIETI